MRRSFIMSKSDENKDSKLSTPQEGNPCGVCRSLGLPAKWKCGGHRGVGGGKGGSSGEEKVAAKELSHVDKLLLNAQSLEESLIQSELWMQPHREDALFEFKNPDSLINIKLDIEGGVLNFSSKKTLSADERKALDEFFDTLEHEFNEFKKELAHEGAPVASMRINRADNNLTMIMPNSQHYIAFVQRLMDKNLLFIQKPAFNNPDLSKVNSLDSVGYQSTAPTPFDMVPRPNKNSDESKR